MRCALGLSFIILCSALATTAQVLPTSSGSCAVAASGLMGCEWISAPTLRKADGTRTNRSGHPELFVTEFKLSSGALLERMVKGDVLIVGMGDGELVNETKSPPLHIDLRNGSVVLMPKEEHYSLRNNGKEDVHVLVVHTSR